MSENSFYQVLLFRDESSSHELGRALWAALAEANSLYNHDQQRSNFERYFLAKTIPEGIEQGIGFDQEKINLTMNSEEWWRTIGGWSPNLPPLDKEVLLSHVRELLGDQAKEAQLAMVTDIEIKPPEGWRYVIWDGDENGTVVSLKPTDPEFWGLRTPDRRSIIKHRVRTAVCSCIGQRLGFKRCSNPQCFLYSAVESVNHLDSMVFFGKEHEAPKLTGLGFGIATEDPAEVQPLEDLSASVSLAHDYPAMSADWL